MRTRRDLAYVLGIPLKMLTYVLYGLGVDSFYYSFQIPKKNGGYRDIDASKGYLKTIQRHLANVLLDRQTTVWDEKNISPNISHAFQPSKSIITNASVHLRKKYVLIVDLEDFFGSIHFGRVIGFFSKNRDFKVNEDLATIIAQLSCYKGRLPQGAPSSPIITNLICNILDMRLLHLAKTYKLDYTRYADDLTFSTNAKSFLEAKDLFFEDLEREINSAGFKINRNKTRLMMRNSRQEVTGLIVNNKVSVKREFYKKTRAMADHLYRNGSFYIDGKKGTIEQLEGRFAFIDQIDRLSHVHNNSTDGLNSREKEYQRFLFFKLFFSPKLPVIVTEGKTDILYIKSALKSNYDRFKSLVTLNDDGSFTFNIIFLRRSPQVKRLFDLSEGGADSFQRIILLYTRPKEFHKKFVETYSLSSSHPVILLYDNEKEKNRPLSKGLSSLMSDGILQRGVEYHDILDNKGFLHTIENLYIATIPRDSKQEHDIEIEDLFHEDELNRLTISGRSYIKKFDKADGYDPDRHFSKNAFAEYVHNHINEFSFDRFIPLLESLDSIIQSFNHCD